MTTTVTHGSTGAARAVGRIPSGLFVLTHATEARRFGMLVSWVQQAGFEPLTLTVALRADRPIAELLRRGARFVLNQLVDGQSDLMRHFARSIPDDRDAFEGLALSQAPEHQAWAGPVLAEALTSLHLEVDGNHPAGDHVVVVARVLDGHVTEAQASPLVHVRKNGTHY